MTGDKRDDSVLHLGPLWRDANVRTGPRLDSEIIAVLDPGDTEHRAVGWTFGDKVVEGQNVTEGEIVSDIWFELTTGGWCSAVNFSPAIIRALAIGRE